LLDRHRIEVMPLRPSVPGGHDQIGLREHGEVLHHAKASHLRKLLAQLIESLPVAAEQRIQESPPRSVGERPKDFTALLHTSHDM
jgi:hypothetical protein